MRNDRAVSHAIGFVLTFSLIVASVGIVMTVGYDQLDGLKSGEQKQNAERAMILLQENVEEVERGIAVYRSGEIDLDQGSLGTIGTSNSKIAVQLSDRTGPKTDFEAEYPLSGAVYSVDGTEVALEGGALLRQDGSGSTMQEAPSLRCTDERAMVSFVTFHNRSFDQLSGGIITTRLSENKTTVQFPKNRTGVNSTQGRADVTIRIESDYSEGWTRYLASEESGFEATGTPGEFQCEDVDRYTVVQTHVDIEFVR